MKPTDYQDLLDELLRKRVELGRRTKAILADTGKVLSADSAEQAVELENAEVLDELAREAIEELGKINMALARHEAGKYGSCIACGEMIPAERLQAIPWAVHCMQCAIRNEERRLS